MRGSGLGVKLSVTSWVVRPHAREHSNDQNIFPRRVMAETPESHAYGSEKGHGDLQEAQSVATPALHAALRPLSRRCALELVVGLTVARVARHFYTWYELLDSRYDAILK